MTPNEVDLQARRITAPPPPAEPPPGWEETLKRANDWGARRVEAARDVICNRIALTTRESKEMAAQILAAADSVQGCDCHNHHQQVCDICQGVDPLNPGKDKEPEATRRSFHVSELDDETIARIAASEVPNEFKYLDNEMDAPEAMNEATISAEDLAKDVYFNGGYYSDWLKSTIMKIEQFAQQIRAQTLKEHIRSLSDDERMGIFSDYCTECGCNDPRCQCWNDE